MATGVNVKMGVTGLSAFKRDIKAAQSTVETLTEALKLNEKQLELNGDKELYLQNKVNILKDAIEAQKDVVKQCQEALDSMRKSGVGQTSTAFQTMQKKVYQASEKLIDLKKDIADVEGGSQKANTQLKAIGQGIAWDNVAEGLGKLTDKLEGAARVALRLGKNIARSAMDSTGWADDLLTRATQYGIDAETLQRMENAAAYIDTDVDTILAAKDKLVKNRGKLSDLLGITDNGKSADDLFWEVGDAIMNLGESFDKNDVAMEIFGKGWRELLPLFTAGQEEYESLMESQNVLTQEQVETLGKADDAIKSIQQELELMKNEFWAENAQKIIDLLQWVMNNSDAVKAGLMAIGAGFGALKLAEVAANVMKITNGFQMLGMFGGGGKAAEATVTAQAGSGTLLSGLIEKMISGMAVSYVLDTTSKLLGNKPTGTSEDAVAKWVDQQIANGLMKASDRDYWIQRNLDMIELTVEPVPEDNAAESISEQIGTVPVMVVPQLAQSGAFPGGAGGKKNFSYALGLSEDYVPHANGLWSVPFDGYPALLHKGERVMSARETSSRSFSSNLYVESMYMNNGADATGLAAAMAAAQKRTMAGFGS